MIDRLRLFNTELKYICLARKKFTKVYFNPGNSVFDYVRRDENDLIWFDWYQTENMVHNDSGPALEFADGEQWWVQNGMFHREDGPAICGGTYETGEFWKNNIQYTGLGQSVFDAAEEEPQSKDTDYSLGAITISLALAAIIGIQAAKPKPLATPEKIQTVDPAEIIRRK